MFKPFGSNPLFSKHSPYGYANLGFKAIATQRLVSQVHQYGDQNLYKLIGNGARKTPETQVFNSKQAELLELVPTSPTYTFELSQRFSLQKAGNAIAECEDIWDYAQSDRKLAIALSDGATESSFAKEWATELVKGFINHDCPKLFWLAKSQQNWQKWLDNQNLSWFAKRKVGQGSFATFLGLEIFDDLSWQAIAMGDSCLFVVRNCESPITNHQSPITDHQFLTSFPLTQSEEFGNRPRLIGTYSNTEQIYFAEINGVAQIGDRFYLVTDAIACWIFKQLEGNQDPWVKLGQIKSQEAFADFVNDLRDRHKIANDDTTLLCLEIKDAPKISPKISPANLPETRCES